MLQILKWCAVTGSALVLACAVGCQTLTNHHSPAIAFAVTPAPAQARANQAMAIDAGVFGARTLSVVTYNMQRNENLSELRIVADNLEKDLDHLPDFILCQEVMFSRSDSAEFGSSAEMLATRLGYYTSGSGRRTAREGLAIVSKYPFEHFEAKQLEAASLPFMGFPRVSVMGEFNVPGVGRVRAVNVHLTHNAGEHGLREKQLIETLTWVAQRNAIAPAELTILGGDFNARPEWREMGIVYDAPPEVDFHLINGNGHEPTKRNGGAWRHRIDYIFAGAPRRELRFVRENVLWPEGLPNASGRGRFQPSDHRLVCHEYIVSSGSHVAAAE